MLRKRKEPKAKKSIAEALLRDMQGTAAQKLALFEKLKAREDLPRKTARSLARSRTCCGCLRRPRKRGGDG
jgi:hypothetical protein